MSTTYAHTTHFRLGADGAPNPSGTTYWEVIEFIEARWPDRTWYTVQHDGWLVAEVYDSPDGWRIASTSREPIPPVVLAEVPEGGRVLLERAAVARETESTRRG
jgi:hypothetical protein